MSSFGEIEQGVHYIRKSLIYSMSKAFLEYAVVELVYKFDEKCYCEKVSQSLKYDSIFFFGPQTYKHTHTHTHIWTPTQITFPHSRCARKQG